MAGGHATYGDWGQRAGFYIGEPDVGIAAKELRHLRAFAERFISADLDPDRQRLSDGFARTDNRSRFVGYLPIGKPATLDLKGFPLTLSRRWFNPRSGELGPAETITGGTAQALSPPSAEDWAFIVAAP